MLLDCASCGKMVRNHRKVAPAENVGVYTIPMESSVSSRNEHRSSQTSHQSQYEPGQFNSDLNLIETQQKSSSNEEEEQVALEQEEKMKSRSRSLLCSLGFDLPLFLALIAVVVLLELAIIPFHRSGYYCKDKAIAFPFLGDTVSMSAIVTTSIMLPLLAMWAVEYAKYSASDYSIKTSPWKESLKACGGWYRDYMYGYLLNFLFVEAMKLTMGSPRPTFLDICEPDNRETCTEGIYVSEFTCTSERFSRWFTMDASRSFPSGHTSLSVYAAIFTIWYLQRRAFSWHNRSVIIVPLLQVAFMVYAVYCSLTRITDHRHHWWDVAVGFVVGVIVSIYTVLIFSKNFDCESAASSSDISSSESGHKHPSVRRLLCPGSSDHTLPHAHIAHMP